MHAWAEPNHNLGYKGPADLTQDQRRHLAWIAASAWALTEGSRRPGARSASPSTRPPVATLRPDRKGATLPPQSSGIRIQPWRIA